jgi:hypothetical protein
MKQMPATAQTVMRGVMQTSWRQCSKCLAMWWIENTTADRCPAGGAHAAMSTHYVIGYQPPPVPSSSEAWTPWQDQWAWCNQCGQLWYAGFAGRYGVCPADGSGHTSSGSGSYWIVLNDPDRWGEQGWRWCTACYAFVAPNAGGVCPASSSRGAHSPGPRGSYTVYTLPATPVAAPSLTGGPDRAQALLNQFAPTVFLHSAETHFPSEVEWYFDDVAMNFVAEVASPQPQDFAEFMWQMRAVLPTISDQTMASQVEHDRMLSTHYSGMSPCSSTSGRRERQFMLQVGTPTRTYPGWNASSNGVLTQPAPIYGAVIQNSLTKTIDLLYAFFYPFNGESMRSFWGIWTHEADWEHVIVRLDSGGQNILGVFMQAHGGTDSYSRWYYPPGSTAGPSFQLVGSSVQVFASLEGHGSYPAAGSFPYYTLGVEVRGEDVTSSGFAWTPMWVLMLDPCLQAWARYTGSWGGWLTGTYDWPPAGPLFQGWLESRGDGPTT